jgi:hypothetical protein
MASWVSNTLYMVGTKWTCSTLAAQVTRRAVATRGSFRRKLQKGLESTNVIQEECKDNNLRKWMNVNGELRWYRIPSDAYDNHRKNIVYR